MSNPAMMTCQLAFNDADERAIQFTEVAVVFDSSDDARGFFAALRGRHKLTCYARDLRFHDGNGYRPIRDVSARTTGNPTPEAGA